MVRTTDLEYSLLMNSMNVSVSKHLLDAHFTVVWANDRYYDMFGYNRREYEDIFHNQCDRYYRDDPEDWQALTDLVAAKVASGERRYETVCRMRHRSGRKLWIKLVGNITDEWVDGCQVSYSVMMDITEQMLIQQEQSVTYASIPGLIAKVRVLPEGFTLMGANPRYYEVFEGRRDFPLDSLTEQSGLKSLVGLHGQARRGLPVCFTLSPVARGRRLHMRVTGTCVDKEGADPIYLLVYDDVTTLTEQQALLKRQNAELERLAFCDPVTEGMNRTRFDLVAKKAVQASPPGSYALVWLNLDKFKLINDMNGEQAGNRTLRYIHDTLRQGLGEGEAVARIAADNYALLLRDAPDEALARRLEAMTRAVNRFNRGRSVSYLMTFTAGVYRIDEPDQQITRIEDRANTARQQAARRAGGEYCACHFYSERERQQLLAEKQIENKMRAALTEGQFEVFLQPKVSLRDDAVVGAEALARWRDPERGLIQPGAFIPVFEKNGFVIQLDAYVFESVCRLLRGWIDRGLTPVPISVNVSRAHFAQPDFVDRYADICARYAVPPALIEIEVTETIVYEDPEAFARIVARIHERGFACSMDDFGSGYSSLNVLKGLDVDTLKIDRAFFASPGMDDPRERNVVQTVVELAKKLNMAALAEGVETERQRAFLRQTDCDLVQGYVCARPMPAAQFERMALTAPVRTP